MAAPGQFFRANAGAVICDSDGLILALERSDVPGAWQLPQGGLDTDEEPYDAVLREVAEETGLNVSELEALGHYPELLAYELPHEARSGKTGRGQVQYWFYFVTAQKTLNLGKEFRDHRWTEFSTLVELVVSFRQPLYRKLADHFAAHVRPRLI